MLQNPAWRRLGARFLRFMEAFGVRRFSMSFGARKKFAKNHKQVEIWAANGSLDTYLSCLRQYTRSGPWKMCEDL